MKTQFTAPIVFAIAVLLITFSCKKINHPLEDVKLIANMPEVSATFNFQFVNAATGEQLGLEDGQAIDVTLREINGDITDVSLFNENEFTAPGGFLGLSTAPDFEPTASNPAKFQLSIQSDGFLSKVQHVNVTAAGDYTFVVPLVELGNDAEGIASVEGTYGTATNGLVKTGFTIESPVIASTGSKVTIDVQDSTRVMTDDGKNLRGALMASLVFFSATDDAARAAYPGGFFTQFRENGVTSDGLLYPAGLVSLEITDEFGKVAHTFDPPLKLTMDLADATMNPNTGSSVKSGDDIDIWSSDVSGKAEFVWDEELSSIIDGGPSDYSVSFEAQHLSHWMAAFRRATFKCDNPITVIGVPSKSGNDCRRPFRMFLRDKLTGFLLGTSTGLGSMSLGSITNGQGVSGSFDLTLTTPTTSMGSSGSSGSTGEVFGELTVSSLCDGSVYNFNVDCDADAIEIKVSGYCPDEPKVRIRPTAPVFYKPIDQNEDYWTYIGLVKKGQGKLYGPVLNQSYTFRTYYNKKVYTHPLTVDPSLMTDGKFIFEDLELSQKACDFIE